METVTGPPGPATGTAVRDGRRRTPPLSSPLAGRACLEGKESTASGMAHRGQRQGRDRRPGGNRSRGYASAPVPPASGAGPQVPPPSRASSTPQKKTNTTCQRPVYRSPALTVHPAPPPLPGSATARFRGARAEYSRERRRAARSRGWGGRERGRGHREGRGHTGIKPSQGACYRARAVSSNCC